MTGREWAEIKVLIAEGNLEVVTKLSAVISALAVALALLISPDWGWVAIFAVPVTLYFYLKPFQVALQKARDYMEKSNFRW